MPESTSSIAFQPTYDLVFAFKKAICHSRHAMNSSGLSSPQAHAPHPLHLFSASTTTKGQRNKPLKLRRKPKLSLLFALAQAVSPKCISISFSNLEPRLTKPPSPLMPRNSCTNRVGSYSRRLSLLFFLFLLVLLQASLRRRRIIFTSRFLSLFNSIQCGHHFSTVGLCRRRRF